MPVPKPGDKKTIERRHAEWSKHRRWWRWLSDSLEGGERYREAVYGTMPYSHSGLGHDLMEMMPLKNLYRHRTEVPDFARYQLEHPDYALRLARTPVPSMVPDAIDSHLAEIFSQEVKRSHKDESIRLELKEWWDDIDGSETSADEWFPEVVMPYLMVLGCIDLGFDRPKIDQDRPTETVAQVEEAGIARCLATLIFPWNVLDWELIPDTRQYLWVMNLEYGGEESGKDQDDWRFRLWTETSWYLHDGNGNIVEEGEHPYGRVPQFRAFDRRNPQYSHVGRSRYERIAELQRETYNKESEIILGQSRAGHPILQAPADMIEDSDGGDVEITPSKMVKMGRSHDGSPHGLEYVDVPQGPSDSIRTDQNRYQELADRSAKLSRPGGARVTGESTTVAQSGISKLIDEAPGKQLAIQIARTAYKAEWEAASIVLSVRFGRALSDEELNGLEIVYPSEFDLIGLSDWTDLVLDFYATVDRTGIIPEIDKPLLKRYARKMLPGLEDMQYAEIDKSIDRYVDEAVARKEEAREAIEQAGQQIGIGQDDQTDDQADNANPFETGDEE